MSENLIRDIHEMHEKFGVHQWRDDLREKMLNDWSLASHDTFRKFLAFRISMMQEELNETFSAAMVNGDPEDVVDGIVDLIVFAIGTLDVLGIDAQRAWDEVLRANMSKEPGVKAARKNKFGLPDLCKPDDWQAPSHEGNHGLLPYFL